VIAGRAGLGCRRAQSSITDGLSRPTGSARCLVVEICVNHGSGTSRDAFAGILAGVKAHGYLPPSTGGNEVAYLSAIVAARDAVLRTWGVYQVYGRSSIARRS